MMQMSYIILMLKLYLTSTIPELFITLLPYSVYLFFVSFFLFWYMVVITMFLVCRWVFFRAEILSSWFMKNGMAECAVCHSKLVSPTVKTISRAYDRHRSKISSKQRALNILLVVGDCMLVGLQVAILLECFNCIFVFFSVVRKFLIYTCKW